MVRLSKSVRCSYFILIAICIISCFTTGLEGQQFNRDQRGGQKLIRFGRAGQKLIRFGRSGRFQGFGDQTEDERQPYEQTYYNPFSTFKRGGQKLIRFG